MINKEVIIIGAGPAGLAAAIEVKKSGIDDVLIIEREPFPGGILNQCIHDGFGVIRFKEALTGPEYARHFIYEARELGIEILTSAMVLRINEKREITVTSPSGLCVFKAGAIILAMGCRERTRGAIGIPGTRPAGIFTAGVAQHLLNIKNIMVGKRIVVLGSGDIGLIMARRLTLEGAKVLAVVEKLPYSSGLPRNITQCLEDYGIPLLLSHTVVNIEGRERLKSVTIAKVDEKGEPVRGSFQKILCDTLILSVGLIPENEIALDAGLVLDESTNGAIVDENLMTNIPGVFACGNVLQVHDLVDHASGEAEHAARSAVKFIKGAGQNSEKVSVVPGKGIRYVVPHTISGDMDVTFSMRVTVPSKNRNIILKSNRGIVKSFRQARLNPAEMVRLTVGSVDLKGISELEVFIDVE